MWGIYLRGVGYEVFCFTQRTRREHKDHKEEVMGILTTKDTKCTKVAQRRGMRHE